MILILHNRYRTTGGEERSVDDLLWLVRERLGEDAELLERDSLHAGRAKAAFGLLRGGLDPQQIARAVRRTRARIVHAHNVHPTLGWRALAAARDAGARVVLHLHQYRMVCAVGVCFTKGEDCTRCHARNTLPGVIHNCRGSLTEAVTYAASLSVWQRHLAGCVDAFVVPSRFAGERLRDLGAPVDHAHVIAPVIRSFAARPAAALDGPALLVSRLSPEKGVDVAIEACRRANVPLVIAGDGPERARLEALAAGQVRFAGNVSDAELARLRRGASLALAPSRSAETFGLAAAEAMAAGLPVVAPRVGALPDLVPEEWLVAPGDAEALADAITLVRGAGAAADVALARARAVSSPEVVAPALAAVYTQAAERTR